MAGEGGWMTARKSNAQIARDKKRAQASRHRQRGGGGGGAPAKKAAKKKRREEEWEDSDDGADDDASMEDFVVDDDDEEEEEADWSEGDEEEEEEEEDVAEELEDDDDISESSPPTSKPLKRKPPAKKTALEDLSSDDEDENDNDDFFSSWSKKSKRKSKAAPHLLKGKAKTGTTHLDDVLTSPEYERKPAAAARAKKKRTIVQSSLETVKLPAKKANCSKNNLVSLSSDDDDDDEDLLRDPFARSNKKPSAAKLTPTKPTATKPTPTNVSRFFAAKTATQKDACDVMDESEQMALALAMSESINANNNQLDDTVPTPVVARRSKSLGKSRVFDDTDDDDDEQDESPPIKQSETIIDIVDSDEDMVVKNQPKSMNRFSKFAAKEKSVLEIFDDPNVEKEAEEEPEDEDDNYDEEEIDEDAKEARSILETAKRLSGQILQTLTTWGGSGGMIVQNGAVTFNNNSSKTEAVASSSWISNETMKKVCPNVELPPYQLIGVNWLALLHKLTVDVNGKPTSVNGVLADEMGCGKTCQTICFLAWLKYQQQRSNDLMLDNGRRRDPVGVASDDESVASVGKATDVSPHLIVVPASVLENWAIEFEKFAPHLNVVKFYGTMAEREEIKNHLRQYLSFRGRNGDETLDVILVPITYFSKEKSDDRSFLKKFRYDYLVCDEAHLIKNHEGQRYRTLDKFKTKHRLLLSGTPVMNNPQELMSLLCFLMRLFSRKTQEFGDEGNDGGARMLQHFVSLDNRCNDDAEAYRKLKELFAPFVLRRRKQDVLSQIMPPKTHEVELVDLDPVARQIYHGILEKHVQNKNRGAREHLFTQLRKAAHHPLLLRTRYLDPSEVNHLVDSFYRFGAFQGEGCTRERVKEEVEGFNDFDIHLTALDLLDQNPMREDELRRYVLKEEDLFSSAKFKRLRTLLPELVGKGHRILIFSVWTSCLDLLSCLLEQLNMKYMRMDGSTLVNDRQALIDQFSGDDSVPIFLLSTRACGLGINLTAADTCIMHDIDFNPAVDSQAEDRCHRIGQTRSVTVYKLIAKDTVDEDIYSMQERKAKMSAAIMESSALSSSGFDSKKERDNVLQSAVDRFLGSPAGVGRKEKESKANGVVRDSL